MRSGHFARGYSFGIFTSNVGIYCEPAKGSVGKQINGLRAGIRRSFDYRNSNTDAQLAAVVCRIAHPS